MSSPRLVIVANRLPVHRGRGGTWQVSPGGLVSAIEPTARRAGATWVGWHGALGPAPAPFVHGGIRVAPLRLGRAEHAGYYQGFANSTLWPLYHDAVRSPEYRRRWWGPYRAVNERFARAAADAAEPEACVWVHDYHLQLVPAMLRRLRPDLRIGFFLHIPFPPVELFSQLPWRRVLLEGLLGADLIGFQRPRAVHNFFELIERYTSARTVEGGVGYEGRLLQAGAFPISIDVDRYETLARRPDVLARAGRMRRRLGGDRRLIVGIDRLDYTKGIETRLRAFRDLLSEDRRTVDDCVLLQVAVPSREVVREYDQLRREVERLVGEINGEFGEIGRAAVHYLRRSLPIEELVATYRAADVMVVNPIRDGMNLVAKEYVATRFDQTGALVLSEFAGAAGELEQALLINPHDVDATGAAMLRALSLPREEAAGRMRAMRAAIRRHTVHDWTRSFLQALAGEPRPAAPAEPAEPATCSGGEVDPAARAVADAER
jgi:trehalose 6-phosphate synthase